MNTSNYTIHFTNDEIIWLSSNSKTKEELFEEIDDITNVNPLENGDPDLRPLDIAIRATKLVIILSNNNTIEGPYDSNQFQIINSLFPEIRNSESSFWDYFSFLCACKRDEDYENKHRIYLSAISNIALEENQVNNDEQSLGQAVYNIDTNEIQQIKGKGVNAVFC